jgi:hypothetical protein
MAVYQNDDGEYIDNSAQAQRVTSVAPGTTGAVARTTSVQRVNTATTTNVAAGAQAYTFTVVAAGSTASPTLGGVALPQGYTASFSITNPGDTLGAIALVTSAGDDVVILKVV